MSGHPEERDLALWSAGDLPFWAGLRVGRHVKGCAECRLAAEQLQSARRELKSAADRLPEGLDWASLEAEMKANIRLGLDAGAIVDRAPAPFAEPLGWRAGVVFASLAFVAATGWYLQQAAPVQPQLAARPANVLEADEDGLALEGGGRAMTLLNPNAASLTTTVSWDGGARSRYVDAETGQVTLHHVYSE